MSLRILMAVVSLLGIFTTLTSAKPLTSAADLPSQPEPEDRPSFWERWYMEQVRLDALRYNDLLVAPHKQMQQAVSGWISAVSAAFSAQVNKETTAEQLATALDNLRKAQENLEKEAADAVEQLKKVKPHYSATGKAFYEAQVKLVETQQKAFKSDFSEIVKLAQAEVPGVEERFTKAREMLAKIRAAEKELVAEVNKLQLAFGKEFDID